MKNIVLKISGMTCSACSNGLEKYLNKQDGIIDASVNLVMSTASINYEDNIDINDLEKYVREAGFKSLGELDLNKKEEISFYPYIIFGILGIIIMYISVSSMFKLPIINILNMHKYPLVYSFTLLCLTIPYLIWGKDIIKSGYINLINKMPNMDTLITIGMSSSLIYSLFSLTMIINGNSHYLHNLYFESIAFMLYFVKLGRYLDKKNKIKTTEAIKNMVTITPKTAKKVINDEYYEVTIDEIKKKDILVCLPGEKIAVDGIITNGITHVDEAFITGESKPVSKKIGDKVIAGSINYEGKIFYEAEKIGRESTISEIVRLVVDATNTKAPIALIADKISSYFVPIILILSLLTLIINFIIFKDFTLSLNRFISVLVVSCPCALGLATPLAIIVSEGVCAKLGIVVKNSSIYEEMSKIDTIVFDKTGTLTNGCLMISKIYNYSKYNDEKIYSLLNTIEKDSNHPIAKGIMKSLPKNRVLDDLNLNITDIPGYGIKAISKENIYYAGNNKLLKKYNIDNKYEKDENKLASDGCSIVYLVENNVVIALVGLKDEIRKESKDVINKLLKNKINVYMLTGDNKDTALKIGKLLNLDNIKYEMTPQDKSNFINELVHKGNKVVMIGDGINDAPSLVLANVGISIATATDVANDAADVILINNDLSRLVDLINISKKTILNIKENLCWAFLYNILMIPIAMGLFSKFNFKINPMISCVAMIFSSLLVTLNALRLRNYKRK